MKKNIFDKFQDWLVASVEKFEKREDKHTLKKVPFWLIFFFPYGIYLLLFKSKIKKLSKVLITLFMCFAIFISVDIALYPNRVYDNTCKESYSKFVLEHKELDLREPLYVSKTSDFKIGDDVYFGFNIYDNFDMYYGIFKITNYHKDYELVSLYEVDCEFVNIYASEKLKVVKDIHPVILTFIASTQSNFDLNKLVKETDVNDGDIFNNTINQELKIDNKIYSFELNDFIVTKVTEKSTNEVLFENISKNQFEYHTPQIVTNILQKNFNNTYKIIGYNYVDNAHYYNVDVAGNYYVAKYIPGVNVNLLLIDDLEEFNESFINLIN